MMSPNRQMEQQFEVVFKTHYPKLLASAYMVVEDYEVARDIVSEVMTEAWHGYGELQEMSIAGWLFRSVRNRCLDHVRHQTVVKNYQKTFARMETELAEEYNDEVDQQIQQLQKIISEDFSPKTRLIFEQCYFQKKRYRDVAEALDISEAAVHKHMAKAYATLRQKMGKVALALLLFQWAN